MGLWSSVLLPFFLNLGAGGLQEAWRQYRTQDDWNIRLAQAVLADAPSLLFSEEALMKWLGSDSTIAALVAGTDEGLRSAELDLAMPLRGTPKWPLPRVKQDCERAVVLAQANVLAVAPSVEARMHGETLRNAVMSRRFIEEIYERVRKGDLDGISLDAGAGTDGQDLNSRAPTVLVVEDQPAHTLFMTHRLEGLGARVLHACTKHEAVEALARHEVSIAIIDVFVPIYGVLDMFDSPEQADQVFIGMDQQVGGLELLAEMAQISPSTRTVVFTAYADHEGLASIPDVFDKLSERGIFFQRVAELL